MPRLDGIEAARQLRRSHRPARLVFLTVNEDPDISAEAITLGASGYLLKNSASGELFTAIERALAGKTYVTPLITKGLLFLFSSVEPRSPRQRSLPRASAKFCNSSRKAAR